MQSFTAYSRTTGWLTILSGILAFGSILVGILAVDNNFEAFADPTQVIRYGDRAAYARWFGILDMLGYYLLLLPAIFYLHDQFKQDSRWSKLLTFSGLAYVIIGAAGAVILAIVWPYLMTRFAATTDPMQRETLQLIFNTVTMAVNDGLWNLLETLLGGIWWMGFGLLLRPRFPVFGAVTVLTGASAFFDSVLGMAGLHGLAELSLNLYLVLGIVWPLWLGALMVRSRFAPETGWPDQLPKPASERLARAAWPL